MNLKRLIAFAVVLATLLSCCLINTSVYADTEFINLATYNGRIKTSSTKENYATEGAYFSNGGSDSALPDELTTLGATHLKQFFPVQDCELSSLTMALGGNGADIGYIRTLSENSERGYYYEVTYPDLKNNLYSKTTTNHSASTTHPVLLFHYYMRIPEDGMNVDKEQVFRFNDSSDASTSNIGTNGRLYVNFTYSGTDHNISISTSDKTKMEKVWGNDVFDIEKDKWYKIEGRAFINSDDKLGLGIYFDNVQVAYYVEKDGNVNNYSKYLNFMQTDFWGIDDSTSPGLTHYDDIHYGLYPASYKPSEKEVDLTANDGVATAKIYGNNISSANLIVALFNGGKFQKLTTSSEFTSINGGKQITCNFPTGVTADECRLFLFDSLTSARPLTEMVTPDI